MKTLILSSIIAVSLLSNVATADTYNSKTTQNVLRDGAYTPNSAVAFDGAHLNSRKTIIQSANNPTVVTDRSVVCSKHDQMSVAACSRHCGIYTL